MEEKSMTWWVGDSVPYSVTVILSNSMQTTTRFIYDNSQFLTNWLSICHPGNHLCTKHLAQNTIILYKHKTFRPTTGRLQSGSWNLLVVNTFPFTIQSPFLQISFKTISHCFISSQYFIHNHIGLVCCHRGIKEL